MGNPALDPPGGGLGLGGRPQVWQTQDQGRKAESTEEEGAGGTFGAVLSKSLRSFQGALGHGIMEWFGWKGP